jgi:hypothetical protein
MVSFILPQIMQMVSNTLGKQLDRKHEPTLARVRQYNKPHPETQFMLVSKTLNSIDSI